ncbi:hypothetical protein DFH28DRAFT_1121984 [Melampsora americana]|nr:hypothetical protein DFH28DRAFT_1121984 [Melampsora americana]
MTNTTSYTNQTFPSQFHQQEDCRTGGVYTTTSGIESSFPSSFEEPLPLGWIKQWNHQYHTFFYVNTNVQPIITQWIHPSHFTPSLTSSNPSESCTTSIPQPNPPPGYTTVVSNGISPIITEEKGGLKNDQPISGTPNDERNASHAPPPNQYGAPSNAPPSAPPSNQYGAPPNGPPPNQYAAPPNGPPPNQYGAPPNSPPPNQYGPPPNGPPVNQYGPPPNGPPPNQYGAPPNGPPPNQCSPPPNGPPANQYGPSAHQYGPPASGPPEYQPTNQYSLPPNPTIMNPETKKSKTGLFNKGLGALGGLG